MDAVFALMNAVFLAFVSVYIVQLVTQVVLASWLGECTLDVATAETTA